MVVGVEYVIYFFVLSALPISEGQHMGFWALALSGHHISNWKPAQVGAHYLDNSH